LRRFTLANYRIERETPRSLGLSSSEYGTITLGRQKTSMYKALGEVGDPFGLGYAGSSKNLFPLAGPNTRTSNTVAYNSPTVYGVSGELTYSAGEQAGNAAAGSQMDGALAYSNGLTWATTCCWWRIMTFRYSRLISPTEKIKDSTALSCPT
jgi:hypothetical protein